jgi:hypothetical protein
VNRYRVSRILEVKTWFMYTKVRAIRTIAQTAMVETSIAIREVYWAMYYQHRY